MQEGLFVCLLVFRELLVLGPAGYSHNIAGSKLRMRISFIALCNEGRLLVPFSKPTFCCLGCEMSGGGGLWPWQLLPPLAVLVGVSWVSWQTYQGLQSVPLLTPLTPQSLQSVGGTARGELPPERAWEVSARDWKRTKSPEKWHGLQLVEELPKSSSNNSSYWAAAARSSVLSNPTLSDWNCSQQVTISYSSYLE